ncbi:MULTISPECIES: ABC transporter substrate-binding protein [Caulobacter]|uniref:ABC-type dipeptide/oligopeptide/nickel transport system, permease component n=1 Tax=Caulobacter vibrioides OR37 TaxID=1292034 RepID=R0EKZ7_CAUVI|nr:MULTISPECIES: ABC transporter substrate-binding protein [Caulobacter]ENZ82604.1 ABC-type dipeptide/oligopeptide/nickel transport system, permease component [Caulobacter vibrioides OR37]
MKVSAFLGLAAACLLAFAPVAQAAPKDTVTVALQLEPPNLDPTSGAAVAVDEVVYGAVFEGLVRLDAQGAVKPLLATWWEIAPDGLTYTFHLRDGVKFQDGTPFDASIVKFSLERAIAPGSTNVQKQALSVIRQVEVVDPRTVRLHLSAPYSDLLYTLAWGDSVMVSPKSVATLATAPVGTGPFRFVGWRRGDAITLVRNDGYWGQPAKLKTVRFRFIGDPAAAFAAIKTHEIDAFPDYPAPENLAQLRADPALKVITGSSEGEVILAINERVGPLADVRVRRAIQHALDRRAIIDGAMYGYGTPIGSHFPPQNAAYVDLTGLYPHDVAKAKALLAQAGYPNGLDLTLKLPPPNYARRSGEIVAAQLAKAGIRVKIETLEWAQWLDQVYGRHVFDLTIVSHAEPMDYGIYDKDDYYFGYHSAAFHRLMQALEAATDEGQRTAILGQIQRQIAQDAVNGFLFQFPRLGVFDARLKDFWLNAPTQTIDLRAASFGGAGGAEASTQTTSGAAGAIFGGVLALAVAGGLALVAVRFGAAYLAGRAAVMLLTLLVASLVVFTIIQVAPGDPAAYMLGLNASPEAIANLRHQMGLEGPAAQRYLAWLLGLLHGDFGVSYTYQTPVAALIAERIGVSLPLAGLAMALSIIIGAPIGALAAARRGKAADTLVMGLTQIGVAIPNFWFAVLLVMVFSIGLKWVSAGGFPGWEAGLVPALKALALPAIALAAPQAAIIARVVRSALIDTLTEDWMRTARAKGLTAGQALWRHGLPNALIPVLTILGLQFPFLLAGGVIIENVFFLPGLGRLVLQAVTQRDLIVAQGVVMLLVFVVVSANFLVDLAYLLVDPRLRSRAR